jgi:urease alpha subunit
MKNSISVKFTSKMALRSGLKNRLRIGKKLVPVRNYRRIGKHDTTWYLTMAFQK